jgi:hypothetical protein
MWLQQTLQLHPKALFATAGDAARAFADVVKDVPARRAAIAQLQDAIRHLAGESIEEPVAVSRPEADRPARAAITTPPAEPAPQVAAWRAFPFLRNVFPAIGAN